MEQDPPTKSQVVADREPFFLQTIPLAFPPYAATASYPSGRHRVLRSNPGAVTPDHARLTHLHGVVPARFSGQETSGYQWRGQPKDTRHPRQPRLPNARSETARALSLSCD